MKLPTDTEISSHRPIIGRFIVAYKKLIRALINPYLRTVFEAEHRIVDDRFKIADDRLNHVNPRLPWKRDVSDMKNLSDEGFVKLGYLFLLRRKIDEVGLAYWKSRIADGTFEHRVFIDTVCSSPEFIMLYKKPFHQVRHEGRSAWCGSLEKFDTIFDIGGSSPNIEMGTLIELGYRHRPKELIIFDLPPEEQYWGKPKFPQDRDYEFNWGTLKYVHGRIENIYDHKPLDEKRFDCVFMGQVIEHIHKETLHVVLKWIREHLKENGKFIFDTPNRIITKIQSPDKLIDEDHKYEYTPGELEEILNLNGFKVVKKTGILAMPDTFRSKNFNPLEAYETELVNDNPDISYLFAFECVKA